MFNMDGQKKEPQTERSNLIPYPQSPAAKLWTRLQHKQLGQFFHYNCNMGRYTLDFYCPAAKLAIEIEAGDTGVVPFDYQKFEILATQGVRVIRFRNQDIEENLNGVVTTILNYVQQSAVG